MGILWPDRRSFAHEAAAVHDALAFLRLAGQQLVAGGYMLTGHGQGWVSGQRGHRGYGFSGLDPAHAITIQSDGSRVRFEIVNRSGTWADRDIVLLNAAVSALMVAYDQARMRESLLGPPPGTYAPPSTHVVERQVVVARCRFCRGHTPLDAPTCQHCGATGFS